MKRNKKEHDDKIVKEREPPLHIAQELKGAQWEHNRNTNGNSQRTSWEQKGTTIIPFPFSKPYWGWGEREKQSTSLPMVP